MRNSLPTLFLVTLLLTFYGCGGGKSSSGTNSGGSDGNGGGGGGNNSSPPTISLLCPSSMMAGIPLGLITIYGTALPLGSQVLVDGTPIVTLSENANAIEAQLPDSFDTSVGIHQFSVQVGSTVTNSLAFTVYNPQQGAQVMSAIPGFLVSGWAPDPTFVVAADVNEDGLSDVVMPVSQSIAVLHGQTDGTLSVAQYIPVSATPYAMAAGDVDGDGHVDLVSISSNNSSSTTVNVLLGNGEGNFQEVSAQQSFTGLYPGPASLVDIDGDGRPDLILIAEGAAPGGNTGLLWLKNLGSGNFAAPVVLATTAPLQPFSVADFNGDGKPDILYMTSGSPNALHILFNHGGGNFTDQAVAGLNGVVGRASVIDFNLDGTPDLVVQVQETQDIAIYSFQGTGGGSFTQVSNTTIPIGPVLFAVGDFDHDGFPDLVGSAGTEPSTLFYLFGDGYGNFTLQQVVGPEGYYIATGDFNGDGLPDVVVPDRFNFVSLALGRTDRNFPSAVSLSPSAVGSISAGDINGDGLLDILIGGDPVFGVTGTIFANQGSNSFQLAANTDPSTFMLADLTGRGLVDLLGGNGPNLVIWPNNLSFDFSASSVTVPQQPIVGPVKVADLDGDGHPDVVSVDQILYGNGMYQFTAAANSPALFSPYVIGDFNGDGNLDFANESATYLNQGNRVFQSVQGTLPLTNGAMAVVGDFNGDGNDDVAINLPGESSISLYYSRGDGTFYQATLLDPGQYPGAMVAGDFDGDGRIDLAVGLMLSQQACIFLNGGNGEFTRSFFASGAYTVGIGAADLNHNGKLDLIINNFELSYEAPNADIIFAK